MTKIDFNPAPFYDRYRVTIKLRERVYGGVPKDPKLIRAWVKSRTGFEDEQTEVQTKEALEAMAEQEAEGMWTGFPADDKGIYIQARQIKAMLRESSTLLGITKKKRGSKQVIQHGFEIKGVNHDTRIHVGTHEPDGDFEGPIHVMTAQGPRTALKRQDYIEERTLSFEVWVLATSPQEKRHIGEKTLVKMLMHAQENGLGASRSQGNGKFDVIEFEKVAAGKPAMD